MYAFMYLFVYWFYSCITLICIEDWDADYVITSLKETSKRCEHFDEEQQKAHNTSTYLNTFSLRLFLFFELKYMKLFECNQNYFEPA